MRETPPLPVDLSGIRLDPAGGLSRQLYRALRERILDGRLARRARLPASRDLAALLGISRNTVTRAFDQLYAEGYIEGRVGAGTFVADLREASAPEPALASGPEPGPAKAGGHLVLYPHFQRQLVPGWLDKALKRRHRPTPDLDNVIVLAPDPDWVSRLPRGKLPDRNDFAFHGRDTAARVRDWSRAVAEAQRMADEFSHWLDGGTPLARVEPL